MKKNIIFLFILLSFFSLFSESNSFENVKSLNDLVNQNPDYDLSYKDGEYPATWTVWDNNFPGYHDWNNDTSSDVYDFKFDEFEKSITIKSFPSNISEEPLRFSGGHFLNEQSASVGRFIIKFDIEFKKNSEGEWFFYFYSLKPGSSTFNLSGNNNGKIILSHNEFGVLAENHASSFKKNESNNIELSVLSEKVRVCVNNQEVFEFHFLFKEEFGYSFWELKNNSKKDFELKINKISLWKIEKNRISQLSDTERDFFNYDKKSNKTKIQMLNLKSGKFDMGNLSITGQQTEVFLDSFSIGKYPITYGEWNEISYWAKSHNYKFRNKATHGKEEYTIDILTLKTPATQITWYDAVVWCNALSEYENKEPIYYINENKTQIYRDSSVEYEDIFCKWDANGYRLPTEAEWEYAARSEGTTNGNLYSGVKEPQKVSNFNENQHYGIVDALLPNSLGIYDMSGNIYEWCWDWFSNNLPSGNNPKGPLTGKYKITRGSAKYGPARQDSFRERAKEPYDVDWSCLRIVSKVPN